MINNTMFRPFFDFILNLKSVIKDIFVNKLTIKNMNQELKKIRRILTMFLFTAAISGLVACEDFKVQQPAVDPLTPWSLQTDIQPIFNNNCATISCHGGIQNPDLREGKSFQALTNGLYVTLPAEQSRLYQKMNTDPEHLKRATETERLKVLYWITQGAQDN
jgi:hypothetical protein